MSKIVKSTTLEGFYATGDHECFCFDRHNGPFECRNVRLASGQEDPDACRVYPNDLLPEDIRGKRGRWTITVEFEPYDDTSN